MSTEPEQSEYLKSIYKRIKSSDVGERHQGAVLLAAEVAADDARIAMQGRNAPESVCQAAEATAVGMMCAQYSETPKLGNR